MKTTNKGENMKEKLTLKTVDSKINSWATTFAIAFLILLVVGTSLYRINLNHTHAQFISDESDFRRVLKDSLTSNDDSINIDDGGGLWANGEQMQPKVCLTTKGSSLYGRVNTIEQKICEHEFYYETTHEPKREGLSSGYYMHYYEIGYKKKCKYCSFSEDITKEEYKKCIRDTKIKEHKDALKELEAQEEE